MSVPLNYPSKDFMMDQSLPYNMLIQWAEKKPNEVFYVRLLIESLLITPMLMYWIKHFASYLVCVIWEFNLVIVLR